MADDKMASSDSAFDDGVPTPTVSRFFELNVFSDPIVKPGNRFPNGRWSIGGLRLPSGIPTKEASTNVVQALSDAKAAAALAPPPASGSAPTSLASIVRDDRFKILTRQYLVSPPTSPTAPRLLRGLDPAHWETWTEFQGPARKAVVEDLDEDRSDQEPVAKRQKLDPFKPPVSALRRYSARTQGRRAAKNMDRVWNLLPKEIQLNVWSFALEDEMLGRVVLLQNRNSPFFNDCVVGSVNVLPDISRVSQQARAEFQRHYKKMFARIPLKSTQSDFIRTQLSKLRPSIEDALQPTKALAVADEFWHNRYNVPELKEPLQVKQTIQTMMEAGKKQVAHWLEKEEEQWVNVDKDVIQIEPCCDGCRACYCIKRQFTQQDREAIRFLCLKGEPWWAITYNITPCWTIVTEVFPNVEILYLDLEKTGPTALPKAKRVMVRADLTGVVHSHMNCLSRFDSWKANEGKDKKLSKVELVGVYEERPKRRGKPDGMQYPWAKTDADDIFVIR